MHHTVIRFLGRLRLAIRLYYALLFPFLSELVYYIAGIGPDLQFILRGMSY